MGGAWMGECLEFGQVKVVFHKFQKLDHLSPTQFLSHEQTTLHILARVPELEHTANTYNLSKCTES